MFYLLPGDYTMMASTRLLMHLSNRHHNLLHLGGWGAARRSLLSLLPACHLLKVGRVGHFRKGPVGVILGLV